jgi:hypothetical protein
VGQPIELQISDAQNICPLNRHTPQKGLNTHQQLREIKGFGQIGLQRSEQKSNVGSHSQIPPPPLQ